MAACLSVCVSVCAVTWLNSLSHICTELELDVFFLDFMSGNVCTYIHVLYIQDRK